MKNFRSTTFIAIIALAITGCSGHGMMHGDKKMMHDDKMMHGDKMMHEDKMMMHKNMEREMAEMQFQVNTAETEAMRAKEMANDAMMRATRAEKFLMKKFDYKMMK